MENTHKTSYIELLMEKHCENFSLSTGTKQEDHINHVVRLSKNS